MVDALLRSAEIKDDNGLSRTQTHPNSFSGSRWRRSPRYDALDVGSNCFLQVVFLPELSILDFQLTMHHNGHREIMGSICLEDLSVVEWFLVGCIYTLASSAKSVG